MRTRGARKSLRRDRSGPLRHTHAPPMWSRACTRPSDSQCCQVGGGAHHPVPRQMLGYTFEIRDMGYTVGNETWTDHLIRVAREADLTGCWWVHSEARADQVSFLRGHVDRSGEEWAPPIGPATTLVRGHGARVGGAKAIPGSAPPAGCVLIGGGGVDGMHR